MFQDMLQRKYQILGQTASSEADLRAAQAGQIRGATALEPGEAAAREAQAYGTAGAERGMGGYYSALGNAATARLPSEIGLAGAQAEQAGAGAAESRARTDAIPGVMNMLGASGNGGNDFSSGTTNVPGKLAPKGQNTDTTPAMLTPGEAVLNRGAAEHLGRDVIDVLNAIGNIKMNANGTASQPPGPATKAPVDGENDVKGYCMGGIPGYAQGSSGTGQIDPIVGTGGTWIGGDSKGSANDAIRASAGLPGKPRPMFSDGTSEVMAATHYDAGRNSGVGEVGNDRKSGVMAGKPSSSDAGEESTRSYAKGTSKVPGKGGKAPPKKAAQGASKITPEMLQQLMTLGKGGGGMIPPGQGAPMPMPMPQVAPPGGMGPGQ